MTSTLTYYMLFGFLTWTVEYIFPCGMYTQDMDPVEKPNNNFHYTEITMCFNFIINVLVNHFA